MKAVLCTTVAFLSIWLPSSPILAATPGIELLLLEEPCLDDDGDGYGVSGSQECPQPDQYVDCDDTDADIFPGAPEVCNGVDDDCDSLTDEALGTTPTDCGIGECASTGELSCVGGTWVDSCIPGIPSDEVCDDLDNDCDGQVDEDVCQSCFMGIAM